MFVVSKTRPFESQLYQNQTTICNGRKKQGNQTSTNFASNVSSILLQTANIVLENPNNKKQVKTKVLFDQGSQKSYLTKRITLFFL